MSYFASSKIKVIYGIYRYVNIQIARIKRAEWYKWKKHANWTGMETISIFIKYNFRSRVLYFQRHETCGLALLFIHATKVNQPTKPNLSQAITSNVILPRCHGFVVDVIGLLKYFEVGHFSSGFGGKNRKKQKPSVS